MPKYTVKDGRVVRANPFCPRCGAGVCLADQGDWWACGKCGTRWTKASFATPPAMTTETNHGATGKTRRNHG